MQALRGVMCDGTTVRSFNMVAQLLTQRQHLEKLETVDSSSPERIDDVWNRFLVFTEGYLNCGAGRTEG
jgi:hypothetical protein